MTVTISGVYCSGLAYLDEDGKNLVRERDGLVHDLSATDFHPMLVQFDKLNPLTEDGREFDNLDEAVRYVDAITFMDRLVSHAVFSQDPVLSAQMRNRASNLALEIQEEIKTRYLDVLKTHRRYGEFEKFIDFSPTKIVEMLSKPVK